MENGMRKRMQCEVNIKKNTKYTRGADLIAIERIEQEIYRSSQMDMSKINNALNDGCRRGEIL
jgi:hypothetical protein